jgi:predicted aldo/keto reductase-like oxidoreductase
MEHSKKQHLNAVDRRNFLKNSVAAAVGTTAVGSSVSSADESEAKTSSIPVKRFGKTEWELPILAYGGAGIPRAWLNPLSVAERIKMVRHSYDSGIRYFDTAGNYMESQPILGEALKDVRDDVYYVSKVETTDPTKVRAAVESILEQMQTDRLDAILIHGTPGIEQMSVERAMEIHKELVKLRDEGITQYIGLSAHSYFDKALALISTGDFDLCMLAYGYIPRGHNQVFSESMLDLREQCLDKAHELDMGVAAMKVVGAGWLGAWSGYVVPEFEKNRLEDLPGAAMRWALKDERIDLLVVGMRLETEIDANTNTLTGETTFTEEDEKLLEDFAAAVRESDAMKKMRID